jgi:hypothetical protein
MPTLPSRLDFVEFVWYYFSEVLNRSLHRNTNRGMPTEVELLIVAGEPSHMNKE